MVNRVEIWDSAFKETLLQNGNESKEPSPMILKEPSPMILVIKMYNELLK
jgi:hypothetical protein